MEQQVECTASIESAAACMICEQQRVEGIHICDEFICVSCESELVHTDVQDVRYPFFIHRMKQIFQSSKA
jgi:hypothetical protein